MSSQKDGARVNVRRMNYRNTLSLRSQGASIGNEHESVIEIFPEFGGGMGTFVDWKGGELDKKLKPLLTTRTH